MVGGKKCILFLFRSADHCEILPAPALPALPAALPKKPRQPAGRAACPRGAMPVSPSGVCHVPPSGSRHVRRSGLCGTAPSRRCRVCADGTCQAPCPSLGAPAQGLPAGWPRWGAAAPRVLLGSWLGAPRVGGGGAPAAECPKVLGLTPRHSVGGVPLPSQNAGCRGGWMERLLRPSTPPHPTAPAGRGAVGLGGAQHRVPGHDTPGCCGAGGAVPTTRAPPLLPAVPGAPAWAGSPGDPHPPGTPHSEPPHQPGPGEPPRHSHPGGAGEGARR